VSEPSVFLNLSAPQRAEEASRLPAAGVGLMRAEFLALTAGMHPGRVLEDEGSEEYVALFRDGLERVARAFHPRPVTYRLSDLKSNEYRGLLGGDRFEPVESNPMIGRRGAFRYLQNPAEFRLEVRAIREARENGLDNVRVMVPFVRTPEELRSVCEAIEAEGLPRGDGFEIWAMAEVPSTALIPASFAALVDGISIGSNDLVQLVLGIDRDSAELGSHYAATDAAVIEALRRIVEGAHAEGRPVSVCGDQPGREPEFLAALMALGVDSVSVVPEAFEETSQLISSRGAAPAL